MRAYAEALHYFLTNREGTAQIVAKYTKVEDRDVVNHAIESEAAAMERTLQVDPKGIELILGLDQQVGSPGRFGQYARFL